MVLLHQQEKIIAQGDGQAMAQKWKDQVFTPSTADKMTIFFYKWFEKNGPIPWAPGTEQMPPIERDSSKLFDTYEMHTKYCTHCQGALRNTEIATAGTAAVAGAKLFWVGAIRRLHRGAARQRRRRVVVARRLRVSRAPSNRVRCTATCSAR